MCFDSFLKILAFATYFLFVFKQRNKDTDFVIMQDQLWWEDN